MSYNDDGLGLLAGGNELGQDAAVIQQAAGGMNFGRRQRRTKTIEKVTFVVSRNSGGGYAATATVGGGLFGGGQKKQYAAPDIGSLLTQIGASARKAFSFGLQSQAVQMQPQQFPQQRGPLQRFIQQGPATVAQTPQAPPATGKVCGNCGGEVPGQFCPGCGTKWEAPKAPSKVFCTNCGAQASGTKFCGQCGNAVA